MSSCTHGHACRGRARERGLEGPGTADHDRRDDRQHEQRDEGLPQPQATGERAVDGTGRGEPGGRGQGGRHERDEADDPDVVEEEHPDREHDLEHDELDRDRRGLAEEDGRAVEAGESQPVERAVLGLDREGTGDREERGEEHRHPEQSRRDPGQDAAVGVEREREEQQHDEAERRDLLQRDARPQLDAEVFAGDERGFAPQLAHAEHLRQPDDASGAGGGAAHDPPGDDSHLTRRERAGAVELVRGEDHGAALARRAPATTASSSSRPRRVEARVRLVEQEQLRGRARARRRARAVVADRPRAGRARPWRRA